MAKKKKQVKKKIEKKKFPVHPVRNQRTPRKAKKRDISNGVKKIKMKVVGIGNGGNAIVADIAQNVRKAKFIVANTDKQLLTKLKRRKKIKVFQFGQEITEGFGTGMDFHLGQEAGEKSSSRIEKLLNDCDLCILIACLGGGTGSGAAPIFARISKKLGNLTYAIFTLPFDFEGEKKLEIAQQALENSASFVNALTIIPNERIFKVIDKKLPLKKALASINKALAFNLSGLIDIIYNPGIVNIDFADLKTVLKGQGQLTYLNRASSKGEERAKKALQKVLSNPLYSYNTTKAKKILFDIGGPTNLSIAEVSEISKGIYSSVKKSAKIIFGVSHQTEKDTIEISLLAVGCEEKNKSEKQAKKRKKQKTKKKEEKIINNELDNKSRQDSKSLKETKEQGGQEMIKKIKKKSTGQPSRKKSRVRKNALQVKKAVQELEEEIRKQEEVWEKPAFLRRKHG